MKKNCICLVCIFTLVCLGLSLASCGGQTMAVENKTYEYDPFVLIPSWNEKTTEKWSVQTFPAAILQSMSVYEEGEYNIIFRFGNISENLDVDPSDPVSYPENVSCTCISETTKISYSYVTSIVRERKLEAGDTVDLNIPAVGTLTYTVLTAEEAAQRGIYTAFGDGYAVYSIPDLSKGDITVIYYCYRQGASPIYADGDTFRNVYLETSEGRLDYTESEILDSNSSFHVFRLHFNLTGAETGLSLHMNYTYEERDSENAVIITEGYNEEEKLAPGTEIEYDLNENDIPLPHYAGEVIDISEPVDFDYGSLTLSSVEWVNEGSGQYMKVLLNKYGNSQTLNGNTVELIGLYELRGFEASQYISKSEENSNLSYDGSFCYMNLSDFDENGYMTALYIPYKNPELYLSKYTDGIWNGDSCTYTYPLYRIGRDIEIPLGDLS